MTVIEAIVRPHLSTMNEQHEDKTKPWITLHEWRIDSSKIAYDNKDYKLYYAVICNTKMHLKFYIY